MGKYFQKQTVKIFFIAILALLLCPDTTFAAIKPYKNPLGCEILTLPQYLKAILSVVIRIGIPLCAVFLVWAGFLFVTARGDAGRLQAAKNTFAWTCIGVAILLGSWLLAVAFEGVLTNIMGGTPQEIASMAC